MNATVERARPAASAVPALAPHDVPAGLRVGAGFAAFFGTLWFAQGAAAAAGPVVAALAVLPGLAVAGYLVATRGRATAQPGPRSDEQVRARTWISRATWIQLAVSVPGAVAVQVLVDRYSVIPFVVLTVGLYLLALAPVVRRPHLPVAGALLTVLPVVLWSRLDGADLTAACGLACGGIFLVKAGLDLWFAERAR